MFYDGKLTLVTGGTGFIGTNMVKALLQQGAGIRVPLHKRPLAIEDSNIETISADLTKPEDCLAVMDGVDYVIHAAGSVGSAGIRGGGAMASIAANLTLTSQVLHAAWMAKVERMLVFSSSTIYPVSDSPVKEDEAWGGPLHPSYFGYGWMRRYIEKMAEYAAANSQVKIALVRPTAVYGPYDNFDPATCHVIPALIKKAVEKMNPFEVWGSGDEVRDFMHAEDFARGCLKMLEKCATCDPVNIGQGSGAAIRDIVGLILKAADHEKAEVNYDVSKPTTIPVRRVDVSKAKKLLNFEPRLSLEEGLADTLAWYKKQRGHSALIYGKL